MKAYRVNVNGNVYEITLEVIDKEDVKTAPAAAPAAPAAPVSEGAKTVTAPMPGNILKVNVKAGQAVKKGEVLMILEAMKMENEISAPSAGTVDKIVAAKGSSVNSGDVLITLK